MSASNPPGAQPVGLPAPVPTVDFYGEAAEWSTASLVHCEPLIERSRLHQWRIRPHRHSSIAQLFLLSAGHGFARFDGVDYRLDAPCVAVIPPRCVHEFEWSEDSDGYALSIALALIASFDSRLGGHADVFRHAGLLDAAESAPVLTSLFHQIHLECASNQALREAALGSLVGTLAIFVARAAPVDQHEPETTNRANHHYQRFVRLVEQRYRSEHGVSGYAAEIGITAPHLNSICRRLAGTSALQLIHNRMLLAARRDLIYTDKTIAGVAAGLGFEEPSYFTRFFKRQMGMTPRAYRRQSGTVAG